jgi:hypothetical protein
MDVTVVGLFLERKGAKQAVEVLKNAGFAPENISVIGKAEARARSHARETKEEIEDAEAHPPGSETLGDAMTGGALGGIIGLLAGVASVMLPESLIVIGPIAGALGGAALGATAGTVVGSLRDLGIDENEAHGYLTSIEAGAVLVAVHVDKSNAREPEAVLRDSGARDVHVVHPQKDE